MLSIGAMGGGQGSYYVGLAREDYYQNGGEPPGRWIGQGADHLGLTENGGIVDREAFLGLFQGVSVDGTPLVQNAGKADRQPGWDLTFSAPKSVSALWACADAETRQAIQAAQFAAVKEACRYIEEEHSVTRRGKGGAIKEGAHLVIATFEHGTSRAQDPQLHTHALILNVAVRADGTTGAIESKPLYNAKMVAGALYRAELAHQLEDIGFRVERTAGRTFAVQGIPRTLTDDFSKRRAEIEATLAERGQTGARAAATAALSTRSAKEHIAREELFDKWRTTGAAHCVTEETIHRGRGQYRGRTEAPSRPEQERELLRGTLREAVTAAMGRLAGSGKSHFSEKELLRAVLEESPGRGVWGSLARTAVRYEIATSKEIMPLGNVRGETLYTTRDRSIGGETESLPRPEKNNRAPSWRQEVAKNFADGDVGKALYALAERGFLHIESDRKGAMQNLIALWRENGAKNPQENLIVAGTQEVGLLNKWAQEARRTAGLLGFRTVQVGSETIHEKDRVHFTKQAARIGVEQGDLGTVQSIEAQNQKITVKLDRGGVVMVPLKEYDGLALGYATATHKEQGGTVKNAYVLCSRSMAGRELTYVQASHANQETHLFTNKTAEQLTHQVNQSRQKDVTDQIRPVGISL